LESERLILRPYVLADSRDVSLLAGDIRVARETMNIPHPYTEEMAKKWISSLITKWKNREKVEYAIMVKENSVYVGGVSFVEVHEPEAEIGYWIGVPYWNRGFCTEAGKLLLRYGKSEMFLSTISARCLSTNPKSGKVLEKLGLEWKASTYGDDRDGNNVKYEIYETPSI